MTKNAPKKPADVPSMIGRVVVVRSEGKTVHIGRLLAKNPDGVLLGDSVYCLGIPNAFVCSTLASTGIKVARRPKVLCSIQLHEICHVDEILLMSSEAVERSGYPF